MNTQLSGSALRSAKVALLPSAFTRSQALKAIAATTRIEDCEKLSAHRNKHVQSAAFAKALKLSGMAQLSTVESEFDALVEKFRLAGKASPERSARASLAAQAQAAQKRAMKEATNA